MELKIKVELDMTERMSGLVTGLIGLLVAPQPPKGGVKEPEDAESAPRGADHTTDSEATAQAEQTEQKTQETEQKTQPAAQATAAQPISEKSAPCTEGSAPRETEQPEKVEADQMKGVIEVTIAKYAGKDWKEKPTPESQKAVMAVSGVLKQIARCVSDQAVEKPTELEGQQRVRFVKELDNIFTNSQGMPEWNPF